MSREAVGKDKKKTPKKTPKKQRGLVCKCILSILNSLPHITIIIPFWNGILHFYLLSVLFLPNLNPFNARMRILWKQNHTIELLDALSHLFSLNCKLKLMKSSVTLTLMGF